MITTIEIGLLIKFLITSNNFAASKEYLRIIQIIFMLLKSAFRLLFIWKFSFKLVTFSKSYAIKQKWVFLSEHSVFNKKLSCHRETARRIESVNILLSHSRSFEMTLRCWVLSKPMSCCVSPYFSIPLKLCMHSEIFSAKAWRDLETGSRSLKMTPFDRSYTTFY